MKGNSTPQFGNICKSEEDQVKLDKALWNIAYQFHTADNTPQDIYQHIVEKVLEKAKQDPQFSNNPVTYIAQYAKWQAQHIVEKDVVYLAYVEDGDQPASDDDELTLIETIADTGAYDPEQEAINNEVWSEMLDVIASLPETHQQVVYGMYIGKKQKEIAKEIGTTPQNITHILNSLRKALGPIAEQLAYDIAV